jgi:hypothetical protein
VAREIQRVARVAFLFRRLRLRRRRNECRRVGGGGERATPQTLPPLGENRHDPLDGFGRVGRVRFGFGRLDVRAARAHAQRARRAAHGGEPGERLRELGGAVQRQECGTDVRSEPVQGREVRRETLESAPRGLGVVAAQREREPHRRRGARARRSQTEPLEGDGKQLVLALVQRRDRVFLFRE